ASLAILARCLFDLALVRRPALRANLNLAGLAWLAGALFVSLIAVAANQPTSPGERGGSSTASDKAAAAVAGAVKPFARPEVAASSLGTWGERSLTLLCPLSVVVGLVLVGWRHFQDEQAGMAAATFYLLLPYAYPLLPATPLGIGRWDQPW